MCKCIFRIRYEKYFPVPFEHSNMLIYVVDYNRRNFYHYDFFNYQEELFYQFFCLNYIIHSRIKTSPMFGWMRNEPNLLDRFLERYKKEHE